MSFLFTCTIGPVQEFIASARRSRDLWYGSWMLSELARAAATAIHTQGGDLIFPTPTVLAGTRPRHGLADTRPSVANKIVATLSDASLLSCLTAKTADGHPAPASIEYAVGTRLMELRDDVLDTITWSVPGYRQLAEQQIAAFLELYWVALPLPDLSTYQPQRALVERLLAARKATRTFHQVDHRVTPQMGALPKSSLDGSRESVIPELLYPERSDDMARRRQKLNRLYQQFRAKQGERLSGVDLLKRRGERVATDADFPSTSHFAALPYLERIQIAFGTDKVQAAFRYYRHELEQFITQGRMMQLERLAERYHASLPHIDGYDASILFDSRLAEAIDANDEATRTSAQELLHAFFATAAGGQRPEPYYVLLHADGDGMGQVIDHQTTVADHQAISQALASFAAAVREIVEGVHLGALVYAGGDDVLAFLPLHTALACAQTLHDRFDTLVGVRREQAPHFVDKQERAPTLSVGIAICHHLEPLSDALDLMRKAEQAAKRLPHKNGLAITLSKRSGADTTIAGSWQSEFFARVMHFVAAYEQDTIPDGAAFELRALDERVGRVLPRQALWAEALRILTRKRGGHGTHKIPTDAFVMITGSVQANAQDEAAWSINAFADELIVARAFAQVRRPLPPIPVEEYAL